MLRRLSVRDIVLIDSLDLDFGAGLGAMTGETGAGKSILLDALGAALGSRVAGTLVRAGAKNGSATAEFEVPQSHPAWDWLREQGYEIEDETLILRRVVGEEGRSRAFVNDQPASVSALRTLGAMLVEIHGQFDDRSLTNPAAHGLLLDAYAGLEKRVLKVRKLHATWRAAEKSLVEGRAEIEEARSDADYVRHSVEELEELAPESDEEATLDADRRSMQRAVSIAEDVSKAADALGVKGAEGRIAEAVRWLDMAAPKADGRLDASLAALDRTMTEMSEAVREVDAAMDALSVDPNVLEQVEERLFALRGLARKHRMSVTDLATLRAKMGERLAFIEAGEERLLALESEARDAREAYLVEARGLSAARSKSAGQLDKAVMKELPPLKLERAKFKTEIVVDEDSGTAEGIDRVSFTVATNPGSPFGAIDKTASGGELSRFLLALKVCLVGNANDKTTIIFDEIDRGVGGATAAAIGVRLRRLGDAGQALVITHAPQVAAEASRHWRINKDVSKAGGKEITTTNVVVLSERERVAELARMLAGETITKAAREAARSLLKQVPAA